jgi:hypothetical protein
VDIKDEQFTMARDEIIIEEDKRRRGLHPGFLLLAFFLGGLVTSLLLVPSMLHYRRLYRNMTPPASASPVVRGAQLLGATTVATQPAPANTDEACRAACKGQVGVAGWTRDGASGSCGCWTPSVAQSVWMSPAEGYTSGFY